MYWGAGPQLGLLTVLGYLFFLAGAATMWRGEKTSPCGYTVKSAFSGVIFRVTPQQARSTVSGKSLD